MVTVEENPLLRSHHRRETKKLSVAFVGRRAQRHVRGQAGSTQRLGARKSTV